MNFRELKEYKKILKFTTFMDFCNRADELKEAFATCYEYGELNLNVYKRYVYREHKFSNNHNRDMMLKDKCWTWLLSYKYEPMSKNDLYSVLGYDKGGKSKCMK